ncbi:MAG: hypothetical protein KDB03_25695 [Planctomycetales bacterium]|nr:hypothetical protein [Planctomycetales bacterium]
MRRTCNGEIPMRIQYRLRAPYLPFWYNQDVGNAIHLQAVSSPWQYLRELANGWQRRREFVWGLLFASILWGNVCGIRQVQADVQSSVDIESSITPLKNSQWYDSLSDDFRLPEVRSPTDNSIRTQGWKADVKTPKDKSKSTTSTSSTRLARPTELFDSNSFTLITSLVLALGLIATLIFFTLYFTNGLGAKTRSKGTVNAVPVDLSRSIDLPFEISVVNEDPLELANRLMASGDVNRAMIMLYGYVLLALDTARRIHLQRGKTNRMYLAELKTHRWLGDFFRQCMLSFEDVYFGQHSLPVSRWQALWDQVPMFHEQLNVPTPRSANIAATSGSPTATT